MDFSSGDLYRPQVEMLVPWFKGNSDTINLVLVCELSEMRPVVVVQVRDQPKLKVSITHLFVMGTE
jgi:hypothetical protein